MKKLTTTLLVMLAIMTTASAQFGVGMGGGTVITSSKVKLESGDPSVLKGETIKVKFIYDGMTVGKFDNEADYIAKKTADYNAKEPGKGDKWAIMWKEDRKTRFEPSFLSKFNELGEKTKTSVSMDGGTKYTLVITTTYTDPGFNVGVANQPARINTICDFQDAGGKTVVKYTLDKVPGQTLGFADFDTGVRLSECYEKLGKDLYKNMAKKF